MNQIIIIVTVLLCGLCIHARDHSDSQQTPTLGHIPIDTRVGETLYIDGEIHLGQAQELEFGAFKGVTTIVLNSPGGDGQGGKNLARVIRRQGLTTVVPAGGSCASACTFAFQGGVERIAYSTSAFMYHGPRFSLEPIVAELDSICQYEGRYRCYQVAVEIAKGKAKGKIKDVFTLLESLGLSTELFKFYQSLPDEPKEAWLEGQNFFLKPNLYFVDDYKHSIFDKKSNTGIVTGLDYLVRFNVITHLIEL